MRLLLPSYFNITFPILVDYLHYNISIIIIRDNIEGVDGAK